MNSAEGTGSANVNWNAMKSDLKDDVEDKIQKGGDAAKQILKNASGSAVDTSCGIGQTKAAKVINEKAPMMCAPIIIQSVNSGTNAITPSVKNAIYSGIDRSVNYSTQKSIDISHASIERGFNSFGLVDNSDQNPSHVEKKLESSEDSFRSFELDSESEQEKEEI